jgi:ABC-type uncharacterized transport system ATPase subunit
MSVQDEIYEWASELRPWKQELFRRAAAAPELSEENSEAIVALLLGESDPGEIVPLVRDEMPGGTAGDAPMALLTISDVKGVNALARGQRLEFQAEALNVVYGINGTGKTGYSRVVKHAGRALHAEPVLSHVTEPVEDAGSAVLGVAVGRDRKDIAIGFDRPALGLLARLCVHDERCGQRYVTSETAMDYAPRAVEAVQRFGEGLAKIAQRLDARIAAARPVPLDMTGMGGDTAVTRLLAGEEIPDVSAVSALATISPEEQAAGEEAASQLAVFVANQAEARIDATAREKRAADRLLSDLRTLPPRLGPAALAEAYRERSAIAELEEASAGAAGSFAGLPVAGVGENLWRALWDAARRYAAANRQYWPPGVHDPDHCVLCQQVIDEPTRQRLSEFETFVSADISQRLDAARAALHGRLTAVPDVAALAATHQQTIEALGVAEGEPGQAVRAWLSQATAVARALRRGADTEALSEPPTAGITDFIETRTAEIAKLAALGDPQQQQRLRLLVTDFRARQALAQRVEEVLKHVAERAGHKKLVDARRQISTTGVSLKVRQLAGAFVNDELKSELERQLRKLNFSSSLEVELEPRIDGGTPMLSLRIKAATGVPLAEVLSVGEQRRLALAMFLAEMSVGHVSSPLVLDDPVCSIDQEGRRHIAKELVRLVGEDRQIIVFTHEMSFAIELRRAAEAAGVKIGAQHLVRTRATTGHVRPSLPWEGLKARDRIAPLEELLTQARRFYGDNNDAYLIHAGNFCRVLRQGYERFVEDDMLAGTVTRGGPVHPSSLDDVLVPHEIIAMVDRGIGENSRLLHAASLADSAVPLTPDELAEELASYREMLDCFKDLRKERHKPADAARKVAVAEARDAEINVLRPKLAVVKEAEVAAPGDATGQSLPAEPA